MMNYPYTSNHHHRQQGVVLLIALVMLLIIAVVSIGLIRSIESDTSAASNIAMSENNKLIADWGVERGFEWLYANRTLLDNDNVGNGYYASKTGGGSSLQDSAWIGAGAINYSAEITPFDWSVAKVFDASSTPKPPTGYTVRLIINRMCINTGASNNVGQSCSKGASSSTPTGSGLTVKIGSTNYAIGAATAGGGGGGSDNVVYTIPGNIYYKMTVRVEGPKNSLSVVQAMLTIAPT